MKISGFNPAFRGHYDLKVEDKCQADDIASCFRELDEYKDKKFIIYTQKNHIIFDSKYPQDSRRDKKILTDGFSWAMMCGSTINPSILRKANKDFQEKNPNLTNLKKIN